MFFCRQLIFFKINIFEKFFQEYHLSVKLIGSRSCPNILLDLIWVQTVCKDYVGAVRSGFTLFTPQRHKFNMEGSGSVVECLTRDQGAVGSSSTSLSRHIYRCLVLVQRRKTRPDITERLLTGT